MNQGFNIGIRYLVNCWVVVCFLERCLEKLVFIIMENIIFEIVIRVMLEIKDFCCCCFIVFYIQEVEEWLFSGVKQGLGIRLYSFNTRMCVIVGFIGF